MLRRVRHVPRRAAQVWLASLLAFTMALGAFTPGAASAGLAAVEAACEAPARVDACDDDLGRILQLLLAVQSQLIQEEEEHPPRDSELALQLPHSRSVSLPEPLLLEGEDMSPALLRPPRAMAA